VIANPTRSQAFHPYAYVLNNPLKYTDPTGLTPEGIPGIGISRQVDSGDSGWSGQVFTGSPTSGPERDPLLDQFLNQGAVSDSPQAPVQQTQDNGSSAPSSPGPQPSLLDVGIGLGQALWMMAPYAKPNIRYVTSDTFAYDLKNMLDTNHIGDLVDVYVDEAGNRYEVPSYGYNSDRILYGLGLGACWSCGSGSQVPSRSWGWRRASMELAVGAPAPWALPSSFRKPRPPRRLPLSARPQRKETSFLLQLAVPGIQGLRNSVR
jgi:hypothetical protein